jgi:hypothetical protein
MSTNANAMIKAGVDAYRAGDKAKARELLEKAVELDQQSEMAWLWLSAVVESKEDQQVCLENVMVINPDNERAKQGLKSLGIDPDTIINQPAEAEPDEDPYAVPSSSASVTSKAPETSAADYDDWVDNLGIGGTPASATQSDDVFADVDFSSDAGFDFGEDLFGDDSHDAGYDDYSDDAAYSDDSYDADAAGYDDYATESDPYGEEVSDMDDLYADIGTLEEFDSMLDEDIHDYDQDEFSGDPFKMPDPEPDEPAGPTLDELFAQIPAEIAPTRLPGSIEPRPTSALIPVAIMGVLNLLAVLFILFQFLS